MFGHAGGCSDSPEVLIRSLKLSEWHLQKGAARTWVSQAPPRYRWTRRSHGARRATVDGRPTPHRLSLEHCLSTDPLWALQPALLQSICPPAPDVCVTGGVLVGGLQPLGAVLSWAAVGEKGCLHPDWFAPKLVAAPLRCYCSSADEVQTRFASPLPAASATARCFRDSKDRGRSATATLAAAFAEWRHSSTLGSQCGGPFAADWRKRPGGSPCTFVKS